MLKWNALRQIFIPIFKPTFVENSTHCTSDVLYILLGSYMYICDRKCRCNVTLRWVHATIDAVEKKWVLHIARARVCLCVRLCSLSYLACNAHVPHCHVWPVSALQHFSALPAIPCDRPPRHRFSLFPCAYKQMLSWFSRFPVATTCFSCSPPGLNLEVTNFMFCLHVK